MIERALNRVRTARNFIRREVHNIIEDSALLLRRSRNSTVLRHRRFNGASILVRADEDMGREIYFHGRSEPNECDYMSQHVRSGDICFDIGANVGVYTLLFGARARQGQVHAFEPVDLNYHVLCTNVIANGLDNVRVNHMAVGDAEGAAEFVVASDGAYSSFIDTGRRTAAGTTSVAVTTLDAYMRTHNVPRIDCLKVDVEGAESRVLTGAAELLRSRDTRPRLVMLELYQPMLETYGSSIDMIVTMMQRLGYNAFVVISGRKVEFLREHHSKYYNVFFGQDRDRD